MSYAIPDWDSSTSLAVPVLGRQTGGVFPLTLLGQRTTRRHPIRNLVIWLVSGKQDAQKSKHEELAVTQSALSNLANAIP